MAITQSKPALSVEDMPTGAVLKSDGAVPTLFTPLKIRGMELQNRFVVSPMTTSSAQDGHLTEFHLVHLGAYAFRGASLTFVESTAVSANGRTSPQGSGLWKDSQIPPLKRVVDFIHAQGQKVGIQINHAGRKASMASPRFWLRGKPTVATEQEGGWPEDVWAPSTIPDPEAQITPKTLTIEHIESLIQNFTAAARRAVQAGVDFIEIHGAHGYLINQFLSPLTNQRTDDYGGSFENRTRFALRVIQAVRNEIPDSMPLSLRISAIEWMEWSGQPCWGLDQSIRLAKLLPKYGVDVLDVSSGGNHKDQKIHVHPGYQIDLAQAIRAALKKDGIELFIAAVGLITSPQIARNVVQVAESQSLEGLPGTRENDAADRKETEGSLADLVFIGRQFLREPEFVLRSAQELGVTIQWPFQYQMIQPKAK